MLQPLAMGAILVMEFSAKFHHALDDLPVLSTPKLVHSIVVNDDQCFNRYQPNMFTMLRNPVKWLLWLWSAFTYGYRLTGVPHLLHTLRNKDGTYHFPCAATVPQTCEVSLLEYLNFTPEGEHPLDSQK